jgi:sugar/nucleoside kinase (ribokinase family)
MMDIVPCFPYTPHYISRRRVCQIIRSGLRRRGGPAEAEAFKSPLEAHMHSVYGVENPLMDIISHVDGGCLARLGKKPGTMNLVDCEEARRLRSGLSSFRMIPGGSCANTIRGIAWLGRGMRPKPVFNGSVGRDATGDAYVESIGAFGVHAAITRKDVETGVSVILVTPDGERTMNTYLGACREFGPGDLDADALSVSRLLHLTGYLWDTENQRRATQRAVEIARGRGATVSLDIADPFVVQRYRAEFLPFIPRYVDILFANREELSLLTGTTCDEDCVEAASSLARTVVMKTGAEGCILGREGTIERVPGMRVKVRDTTGAGDAFAAGFLYGILEGFDFIRCADIANRLAASIVEVEGCDYLALEDSFQP